jgi:hypothetical protein
MERQMEMFEDGGLMDEGGTVDPVSGNEVPPGSTQEEVRDDIPAQLSEGEFVIPADVVRYIGLGNLMQMRQEAKLGLKLMEEMGQMGNSEEATMPDDLPFDINDLDMEDEAEYNVGGFVPGTQQQQQFGISGFQQAAAPTTGVAQPPVQAASQQFVQPTVRPQQAAVPTMKQYKPAEVPTFEQTIGQTPGQYDELRTYKNEAGMTMQIPFKNGQPIYPIPEGYKFVDPEKTKTEEVTTTPTTPQTTTVRDTSDSDERRRKEEEKMYGPGGGRLGVGGEIYGVSFDAPKGSMPGVMGSLGIAGGLFSGKGLPKGATATIKRGGLEFTVTADEYNTLKTSIEEDGANSIATGQIFEDIQQQALERKGKAAQQRFLESLEKDTDDDDKDDGATKYSLTKEQLDDYAESYSGVTDFSFGDSSPPPEPASAPDTSSDREFGGQADTGGGQSFGSQAESEGDFAESGSFGGFDDDVEEGDFNVGGLASKKKRKSKKMKRGGLASKK